MSFGPNGRRRASPSARANLDELVLTVLGDYLSGINARLLLQRSLTKAGQEQGLNGANLALVLNKVETGAGLFVAANQQRELRSRLAELEERHGATSQVNAERIQISSESDIVVARTQARKMCDDLGARGVTSHKVATVVSELARNIVSYAERGTIDLTPSASPPSITVKAQDQGQGIDNVDEILAGRYQSRTGLGLGLAGSKRLAERFDIQTGPSGTTIVVEMSL